MKLRHAFLPIVLILAPTSALAVCDRAGKDPIADDYRISTAVIAGQVVTVEILTETPIYDENAEYRVTIKPVKVFKGANPGLVAFNYVSLYHGETLSSALGTKPEGMTLREHDENYLIGDLLVAFLIPGQVLRGGGCSWSVLRLNDYLNKKLEGFSK